MKRTIMSGAFLVIGAVLFGGCNSTYQYHVNTKPRYLSKDTIIKLNVTGPVAIRNVSSKAPSVEEVLGGAWSVEIMGSLYDFTEVTIGITKDALQRNNVTIDDKADKKLELSVDKADSERGAWNFSSGITLKAKTGSGLEKEYTATKKHGTGYSTTGAFEMAMVQCVEQMLEDKDIVAYLEK